MVLYSKFFADRFQFPTAFRCGFGIGHFKFVERIKDNAGNNQPGILLIIGGNDEPGCVPGAGRVQALFISLHVMLPIFPFVNVSGAEFPILLRLINAFEKSLSLLVLRQVQEKFDDAGAVAVEVLLQIYDGLIPLLPNGFLVEQLFRKALAAENLRMHSDDQHFLVIGTIEDADPPAFRQMSGRAPEKIMFQFVGGRLFETENLAALRIDPGHDVPDRTVLAARVHPLKNQQQRIAVGGVVQLLQ